MRKLLGLCCLLSSPAGSPRMPESEKYEKANSYESAVKPSQQINLLKTGEFESLKQNLEISVKQDYLRKPVNIDLPVIPEVIQPDDSVPDNSELTKFNPRHLASNNSQKKTIKLRKVKQKKKAEEPIKEKASVSISEPGLANSSGKTRKFKLHSPPSLHIKPKRGILRHFPLKHNHSHI